MRGSKMRALCLLCCLSTGIGHADEPNLQHRVASAIHRFLENRVRADSLDVSIVVPDGVAVSPGDEASLQYAVDWNRGDEALTGRVYIPVQIRDSGKVIASAYGIATIRRFQRVCVSTRLLNRHAAINEASFRKEMREVTQVNRPYFKDEAALLGMRSRRVIGMGRIITSDMVEEPPVINRGDRVEIRLLHSNLTVTMAGIAREDGWLGDRIRVRSIKYREEVNARVKSPAIVEVKI